MSLSLSALRELVAIGLTAEQILRVAEAQAEASESPRHRTKAASAKHGTKSGSVRKRQKTSVLTSGMTRQKMTPPSLSLLPPRPPNHPHPPASIIPPYPPRPGLVGSPRFHCRMVSQPLS